MSDNISVTVTNRDDISVSVEGGVANNYVNSDTQFYFNGQNGDTYLVYNSSRNKLELYVNGSIIQDWP